MVATCRQALRVRFVAWFVLLCSVSVEWYKIDVCWLRLFLWWVLLRASARQLCILQVI